jgi:hypothetical protein
MNFTDLLLDIVLPLAWFGLCIVLSFKVGSSAKKRGRSQLLWTILAIVFTPFPPWIVLVLLPDKSKQIASA